MPRILERKDRPFLRALLILTCLHILSNSAVAAELPWIGPNDCRILLSIGTQRFQWKTTPVCLDLSPDLTEEMITTAGGQLSLSSIRIVAYDKQGKPLVYKRDIDGDEKFYIPYRLRQDCISSRLAVSWRMNLQNVNRFAVSFSQEGAGPQKPMSTIGLVGDGDFLSFGRRGVIGPISGGFNATVDADDCDGDGDVDLFIGFSGTTDKEGIYYFENIATAGRPLFRNGGRIYPSKQDFQIVDWDKDGDPEILVGDTVYELARKDKSWMLSESSKLPKHAGAAGIYIDWDGDGLADYLALEQKPQSYYPSALQWEPTVPPFTSEGVWLGGNKRSTVVFHKNIDSAKEPAFAAAVPVLANDKPVEIYGTASMTAGDWDGDGDHDLFVGDSTQLLYFENVGSAKHPKLRKGISLKTADGKEPFSIYVRPSLSDLDRDGDLDIILGSEDGRVTWIEQRGAGRLGTEEFILQLDPVVDAGCLSVPVSCDWDDDGDIDLLIGNSSGFVEYFENTSGLSDEFVFEQGKRLQANGEVIRVLAGYAGSVQGPDEAKFGYTMPEVADWDGDGDLDLLLSDIKGEHYFYENVGTKKNPKLAAGKPLMVDWPEQPPKPSWVWWQPGPTELVTGWRCRPATIDWNKDGLVDYVAIDHEGYVAYYEGFLRDGQKWLKPGRRVFEDSEGIGIRISDFVGGQAGRVRIAIADWDGDGDLDIIHNAHQLFGETTAVVKSVNNAGWYENMGPSKKPVFKWRGEIIRREIPPMSEHSTSPEPIDLDGDGRLDLLLGGEYGKITCYHRAYIEDDLPTISIIKTEKRND